MKPVSILRLNLLRCGYLLLAGGLGAFMWPQLLSEGPRLEIMHGLALSMLCALGALCVLGLRYPLRMLPLLLFEITWKAIWLLRIALPLWRENRLDDGVMSTLFAVAIAVVFPFVIPWKYVLQHYILQSGDPWWKRKPNGTAEQPG